MKPYPFIAKIDNRWRARRVLARLVACQAPWSDNARYYQRILDATFFTGMNNDNQTDFWATMAELDAEVARFQAAVEEFCEAKKDFLANL